jgi:hypothetical protein
MKLLFIFVITLFYLYDTQTTSVSPTTSSPTSEPTSPLTSSPTPSAQAPYCHVGTGLVAVSGKDACFSSSGYSVTNCCYFCIVTNSSGQFYLCGSLYELNGFFCVSTSAGFTKAAQLCYQNGGASPGSQNTNIACQSDLGLDNTQWNLGIYWNSHNQQLPPSNTPISISQLTMSPTNQSPSFNIASSSLILLISILIVIFLI